MMADPSAISLTTEDSDRIQLREYQALPYPGYRFVCVKMVTGQCGNGCIVCQPNDGIARERIGERDSLLRDTVLELKLPLQLVHILTN